MVGTIARPSSPSVRFTALELPIITSMANTGKNVAERDQHFLEHRHGQLGAERLARQQRDPDRGEQADHRLHQQLDAAGNALVVALA